MKKWTVGAILATLAAAAAAISNLGTVDEFVDPLMVTEQEAADTHEVMNDQYAVAEQTQAGFNAYTLSQLLEQEIAILKLQIETESDQTEKEILQAELAYKQDFIRKLQEEERRQMLGAEDTQ